MVVLIVVMINIIYFFNDTATTEIYTLSLHDALPISSPEALHAPHAPRPDGRRIASDSIASSSATHATQATDRSEEHTSELQSRPHLVCRLLLEKKNKAYTNSYLNSCYPHHIRS